VRKIICDICKKEINGIRVWLKYEKYDSMGLLEVADFDLCLKCWKENFEEKLLSEVKQNDVKR